MQKKSQFAKSLLAWFDQHGRKDLPWQQQKSAYRVWVSEIMLQQTQVSTVIPYFQRFIAQFPTLNSLAEAKQDQVLHYWSGLGYYSRARNLHRSAQIIVRDYEERLPLDLETLQTLPGIGRSTAGAILAIADQQSHPILDGNVKRVLTRLHGIREWAGDKKIEAELWRLATAYTPKQRAGDYTQAIMDLGATLCTRIKPQCERCPFTTQCMAYQQQLTHEIPQKKPTKILPVKRATALILQYDHKVLLQKRPSPGIWGGLWSFPDIVNKANKTVIKQKCAEEFKLSIEMTKNLPMLKHRFTHFQLELFPVVITLNKRPAKIMASAQQVWYNLRQPQALGLPAPIQVLLRSLSHALS